jgi:DNA end-binding protein Ku
MARPSWEGYLKVNLLSVPVRAYTASVAGRGRIGFHQLHKGCGERIRHQKVCPVHGEVTQDEVVAGYEAAKGQYVTVEKGELARLKGEDEKAIAVAAFVRPDAIDPIYYSGRHYYLTPSSKVGETPYAVLRRVMAEQERFAFAQVFFSGRKQPVLVRPTGKLLVMALLNYAEQVRPASAFADEAPGDRAPAKEVELAETLVETATDDDFELARYRDEYEADLKELLGKKSRGKKVAGRRRAAEPAVINLMDALRRSLAQAKKGQGKSPRRRARAKSA